jgi:hypothetical protein
MRGRDFYHAVDLHEDLEWLGSREGKTPDKDAAIIRHKPTTARFAVAVQAVRDNTWNDLLDVLTGKRSPQIMVHITRIVGYYSMVQNWNRSKIAELDDRHKGEYGLDPTSYGGMSLDMTPVVPLFTPQPEAAMAAAD